MEDIPEVILFDLDDTLGESFKPPERAMIDLLGRLLLLRKVGIMSAATFDRIERDVIARLPTPADFEKLFIFPTSGAQCYLYMSGEWEDVYNAGFTDAEREMIMSALRDAIQATGITRGVVPYGERIIDRGSEIVFTPLGEGAPNDVKSAYDPDGAKRSVVIRILKEKIPGFEIRLGGRTTIDITPAGIDKSHGVEWLSKKLGVPASNMLYVGDALYPGGNDEPVKRTGIQTREVRNPEETRAFIDVLLGRLGSANNQPNVNV